VYTIFDFYANNIPDGSFLPFSKILQKIVKTIEFWGINCSDLLILVDESRIEEIQGATVKNLIYIYNTPEDQKIKANHQIQDPNKKFTIFFAGILLHTRGITDMIMAVSDLSDVQLTLAGPLIDTDILDKIPPHSDHIHYIGWIPSYQEILDQTMSADILFRFSDPKHPKTKYESPNKLFEAMMCGKPIIVSDSSAMATIVRQNNCGIVVPYGDINVIKQVILSLKNDPDFCKKLGINGRKAYEQKYSWNIMEKRLLKGYDEARKNE
jgi:glycosyltransferase involved in cell wall biosynthesis